MAVYTILEHDDPPADRVDRAEQLMFVRDGFTWNAALLPPFWFAANQAWAGLIGYLLAAGAIVGAGKLLGLAPLWAGVGIVALHVFAGLEAGNIVRAELTRRGWNLIGTVSGRSLEECQRRFFDDWLPRQPVIAGLGGTRGGAADPIAGAVTPSASGRAQNRDWRRLFGRGA